MTVSRHPSAETLAQYVASGVAASIPLSGHPAAILVIDPPNDALRLEVEWDGEEPPVINDYIHISTDVTFRHGQNWATITVRGSRFFDEAYPLLRSVTDLMQLESETFTQALSRSLGAYHDLLAATAHMPPTDEIGLFGELLVVADLVRTLGASPALECWRGGDDREEHDLGFEGLDVEIKTTVSEQRRHWIGSLNQLTPSIGRPLWLLSIQITGAGRGGRRLPDLVDEIESSLTETPLRLFRSRMAATTFRPAQPREAYRAWRLRTQPACFLVDDGFPHLTRESIHAAGADLDRIEEVAYTIRLDTLTPNPEPPAELSQFVMKGSAT